MRDPLDALERFTLDLARHESYNARNRRVLLAIHGVGAMCASVLLLIDSPARSVERYLGDWLLAFNATPLVGGALLLAGLIARRNLLLESVGMLITMSWHAAMGGIFLVAARQASTDNDPTTIATSYPVAVYGTLAALMIVHIATLVLLILAGRR